MHSIRVGCDFFGGEHTSNSGGVTILDFDVHAVGSNGESSSMFLGRYFICK